jgi:hypothetical protein
MKLNKPFIVLATLTLMLSLAGTAQATTLSFNVQAGTETVKTIKLAAGDHVLIKFSALGDETSTINFWVAFPNGTTTDYGRVSQRDMSLVSETSGQFAMHFDNSNSTTSKLVTLNYEVEHYYFGMPSVLFIVLAITVLLVCVVAGYLIMGKYSWEQTV